eukprot:scaffold183765_cov20-Prasinocladus_malaysianus.AAC.1
MCEGVAGLLPNAEEAIYREVRQVVQDAIVYYHAISTPNPFITTYLQQMEQASTNLGPDDRLYTVKIYLKTRQTLF